MMAEQKQKVAKPVRVNKPKVQVKCSKCNYEWDCSSEKIWVTCSNCQNKSKRIKEGEPVKQVQPEKKEKIFQ